MSDNDNVSNKDLLASFSGPSYHANKLFLTTLSSGVRITFMEQIGTAVPAQFRTSVFLSYQDVVALRDLITRTLPIIEPAPPLQ